VKRRTVCGHTCAGLFAGCDFGVNDVATLYGGEIKHRSVASKTHSRGDRGLGPDYCYDGHSHSGMFEGSRSSRGSRHLRPRSPDSDLCYLVENTGIGYMANTVTRDCPSKRNIRTNLKVVSLDHFHSGIPVQYGTILALIVTRPIRAGEELVCLYEYGESQPELHFYCTDKTHSTYHAYSPYNRANPTQRKKKYPKSRHQNNDQIVQSVYLQVTAATREGVVTRYKSLPQR
jgi:hypothetical protein